MLQIDHVVNLLRQMCPADSDISPTLIDVGASGGIHRRWRQLGVSVIAIGFEPDEREYIRLVESGSGQWFNTGLFSSKQNCLLNVTRWQTNTSLLSPNLPLIRRIYSDEKNFDIIERKAIACDTLDNVASSADLDVDILKLDTQGTELQILQGAEQTLRKSILAVEVEVEFIPLYENQPLFADVDAFMRSCGFQIVDCGNMLYHKLRGSVAVGGTKGQLISADALYLRNPETVADFIQREGLGKLYRLILVYLAYGYLDCARDVCTEISHLGLLTQDEVQRLDSALAQCSSCSRRLADFKGRERLHRWFTKLAELCRPTRNAYWLNRLGNR